MEVNILFLVSHTGQPALRSASLCLIRSFPKWPPVFAHRYVMRTGTNTHTHTHSVCQGSLVCFGNFGPGCQSPQVVQGTRWWRTSGGDDQQVPLRLECSRSESQLDFLLSRRVKTPNHSLPQLHNLFIPQTSTTQISSHALSCTLQFFFNNYIKSQSKVTTHRWVIFPLERDTDLRKYNYAVTYDHVCTHTEWLIETWSRTRKPQTAFPPLAAAGSLFSPQSRDFRQQRTKYGFVHLFSLQWRCQSS